MPRLQKRVIRRIPATHWKQFQVNGRLMDGSDLQRYHPELALLVESLQINEDISIVVKTNGVKTLELRSLWHQEPQQLSLFSPETFPVLT